MSTPGPRRQAHVATTHLALSRYYVVHGSTTYAAEQWLTGAPGEPAGRL
ncbi:hypothetical protein [Kribbella yunnanensis]